jgi:hypothetical protein
MNGNNNGNGNGNGNDGDGMDRSICTDDRSIEHKYQYNTRIIEKEFTGCIPIIILFSTSGDH